MSACASPMLPIDTLMGLVPGTQQMTMSMSRSLRLGSTNMLMFAKGGLGQSSPRWHTDTWNSTDWTEWTGMEPVRSSLFAIVVDIHLVSWGPSFTWQMQFLVLGTPQRSCCRLTSLVVDIHFLEARWPTACEQRDLRLTCFLERCGKLHLGRAACSFTPAVPLPGHC